MHYLRRHIYKMRYVEYILLGAKDDEKAKTLRILFA